ncbi:hypothetical protein MP638_005412 [Amoeboaphelidium occidentale]|nr:hypothetical protein MP638_005412 [Amoeboaphelidium occidentale]
MIPGFIDSSTPLRMMDFSLNCPQKPTRFVYIKNTFRRGGLSIEQLLNDKSEWRALVKQQHFADSIGNILEFYNVKDAQRFVKEQLVIMGMARLGFGSGSGTESVTGTYTSGHDDYGYCLVQSSDSGGCSNCLLIDGCCTGSTSSMENVQKLLKAFGEVRQLAPYSNTQSSPTQLLLLCEFFDIRDAVLAHDSLGGKVWRGSLVRCKYVHSWQDVQDVTEKFCKVSSPRDQPIVTIGNKQKPPVPPGFSNDDGDDFECVLQDDFSNGFPSAFGLTRAFERAFDQSVSSGNGRGGRMKENKIDYQFQQQQQQQQQPPNNPTAPSTTSKTQDHSSNAIDLFRIMNGHDTRTTFMIKNIPNKYTQKMLLEMVDESHKGTYDFVYLRMDFKNKCNVGYAFINFIEPSKAAVSFALRVVGKKWKLFNSDKICELTYANIQGKQALVDKFRDSTVMFEEESYRPKIFYSSGPKKGMEEPFPLPTKLPTTRRRINNNDHHHHHHQARKDQLGNGSKHLYTPFENSKYGIANEREDVSEKELKQAYLKCVMKYHPDTCTSSSSSSSSSTKNKEEAKQRFQDIQLAYDLLKSRETKSILLSALKTKGYDEFIRGTNQSSEPSYSTNYAPPPPPPPPRYNYNYDDIYRQARRRQRAYYYDGTTTKEEEFKESAVDLQKYRVINSIILAVVVVFSIGMQYWFMGVTKRRADQLRNTLREDDVFTREELEQLRQRVKNSNNNNNNNKKKKKKNDNNYNDDDNDN